MKGISPFTEQFKCKVQEANVFSFKCNKCEYELLYLHELVSWKNTVKAWKKHLKDEHGIII